MQLKTTGQGSARLAWFYKQQQQQQQPVFTFL